MNANQMVEQIAKAHGVEARFAHLRAHPLYSTLNLAGYADDRGVVQPQKLSWFSAKEGGPGTAQGFPVGKNLHRGLTNFSGSPNIMPAGMIYVAMAAGVRLVNSPDRVTPRHVLGKLTAACATISVRRGDSTEYQLGALEHWPAGRFGLTSRSVAALGEAPANGDMTLIDYPQNGDSGLRVFAEGSELFFKNGELIEVNLTIHEPITLTDNGQPLDLNNLSDPNNPRKDIRDCLLQFIFDGYSQDNVV